MFLLVKLAFYLVFPFGSSVNDLDHPEFSRRQAASARLVANWPASWPSCFYAEWTSESPEVAIRVEAICVAGKRKILSAPPECWDEVIQAFLEDPYETAGLPWSRSWTYNLFEGTEAASEALVRVIRAGRKAGWVSSNYVFGVEYSRNGSNPPWPPFFRTVEPGLLYGLDDLRFQRLGLPPIRVLCDRYGEDASRWWAVRRAYAMKKFLESEDRGR